jgi:hypothetical protein
METGRYVPGAIPWLYKRMLVITPLIRELAKKDEKEVRQ